MKTIAKLLAILAVTSIAACASVGTSGRSGTRPMTKPAPQIDRDLDPVPGLGR
jgi:hypothetical protein